MMGYGLGIGFFHLIWMLLFWGGLIILAVWLIGLLFPATRKQNSQSDHPRSALEILKARYAQGELTEEQYHQMLQTIQQ